MTVDYAGYAQQDFELRDDLVEVVLVNGVTGDLTTGVVARTRALNFREAMLGGQLSYEPTDMVWELGARSLGAVRPQPNDYIVDVGGARWTIRSVDEGLWGSTPVYYVCVSRKQYDG
jgi:hypothetical protein